MKEANENYNEGSKHLETSCIKCRCKPNYSRAIPYFKLAADSYHGLKNYEKEIDTRKKLVKCFMVGKSHWEEGKEYEKISKVQINQLKSPSDAYDSIECAFHAYINNHSYDNAIKALMKSSDDFIEQEYSGEAEKALSLAFNEGIEEYFHVITLDEENSYSYIYDCIDKYIDLLFSMGNFKKSAEISERSAKLIKKEQKNEVKIISKYYALQAISHFFDNDEENYNKIIKKGIEFEKGQNNLCYKIKQLVDLVKENNKNNQKNIKSLLFDISNSVPNNVSKKLNYYINENAIKSETNSNKNENNNDDKFTDYEDLK